MVAIIGLLLRQFVIPVDDSGTTIYQPAGAKQDDGVVSSDLCLRFFGKWKARKDGGQVFMGGTWEWERSEMEGIRCAHADNGERGRGQSKLGPGPRELGAGTAIVR